eukprot:5603795-Pyramimonas_sp.AAC.1
MPPPCSFFHPRLPTTPVIFVEVALTTNGVADSVQKILDLSAEPMAEHHANTAVFYSISNTQVRANGSVAGRNMPALPPISSGRLRLWRARGTISGGVARRELRQPADQARGRLAAEGPPQHKHLPHPLASAGLRQVAARAPGPAGRAPKSDHPRGAGFPGGGDAERRPRRCRAHPPHRRRRPE